MEGGLRECWGEREIWKVIIKIVGNTFPEAIIGNKKCYFSLLHCPGPFLAVKSTSTFGIDVLHTKIQCDGCEKPVRGDRFKCVVCSDYDLCHQCQCRGVHSEHDMLCIRTPGSRTPVSQSPVCFV